MDKLQLRMVQSRAMNNLKTWKGICCLEEYIGYSIDWLHPKPEEHVVVESDKRYAVVDVRKEKIVFESNTLFNISKEFCVNAQKVSRYFKSGKLLDGKYMVVRCKHE